MSNQPDIDNQDLPTQAPAVEKGKINVQAANSSLNANRVFNDHYMDAKNHHAEAVNGLSPSTSILDGKAKGPDIKDAIENLKVQYADNLPKNEQLNRKEQLKDITAKTKTGKFSDKIQSELEKELELAEKDDPKDDDLILEGAGQKVVVDSISLPFLANAVIDFSEELIGARFVIENPNATSACGCGTSFSM